jgi:hypothetical protein
MANTKPIVTALAAAGTEVVADRIKAAASTAAVSDHAARTLAAEALQTVVETEAVQTAVAAVLPKPIAWWKSQALWGSIVAGAGAVVTVSPDVLTALAGSFPEHAATLTKIAGSITTALGIYNAVRGRITTTRPIAGTEAAQRVAG